MNRLALALLALGGVALLASSATATSKEPREEAEPEPEPAPGKPPAAPDGWRQIGRILLVGPGVCLQYASLRYGPRALGKFPTRILNVENWTSGGGIVTSFEWTGAAREWRPPGWLRAYGYVRSCGRQ